MLFTCPPGNGTASALLLPLDGLKNGSPSTVRCFTGYENPPFSPADPSCSSIQRRRAACSTGCWPMCAGPQNTNKLTCSARVLEILFLVFENANISRESGSPARLEPPTVSRALDFIRENCHRPLTVDSVAKHCGVAWRTLERNFAMQGGPPRCQSHCPKPGGACRHAFARNGNVSERDRFRLRV